MTEPIVGIIMGSDSDLEVMRESAKVMEEFKIPFEILIVSAHRTPLFMSEYALKAKNRGIKVIIAGAGGAAHLPGMAASHTTLPVIGVPIKTRNMEGLDSLLSIVQMPKGIPVATVAVNGAANAGLLAVRILAQTDDKLAEKLEKYQVYQKKAVLSKSNMLKSQGYKKYLSGKSVQ